jgi:AcrR family transcriptional regulator
MHPTRQLLIDCAILLLDSHSPEAITGEMILKSSRTVRGSPYHHFTDLSELIETALVTRFARYVDWSIAMISEVLNVSQSREELLSGLIRISAQMHTPDRRNARMERARVIGAANDNDRLASALAVEQDRLTNTIADLFRQAQGRGLMSTGFDAHVAAVFTQAYTLGKIIDDVASNHVSEDEWARFLRLFIERVLIRSDS